jgi:hypothetical protein
VDYLEEIIKKAYEKYPELRVSEDVQVFEPNK